MVALMSSNSCVGGYKGDVINSMWAGATLDRARFDSTDHTNRILARYGEHVESDAHYPGCDVLADLGFDTVRLAACLDGGVLSAAQIGEMVEAVRAGQITRSDVQTAIDSMIDRCEAACKHPDDLLDQALHARGLCCCHSERAV